MNATEDFDVVVIGGGPAGTTAATLLQRHGHRCAVIEAREFPRYHIGESLIPHTYRTLDRLGLLPKLRASAFPVKHSVRFVDQSGHSSQPFYFSETIEGPGAQTWQVTRAAFDQMCLDNAVECGVEVDQPAHVSRVLFDGEQAVGVRVKPPGGDTHDIGCKVIIDASGRGKVIGRQLGLTLPVDGLNKASLWAYYHGGKRLAGKDAGETTVFMIPDRGWFWYIPLADDIVSVGVVADPGYLFDEGGNYPAAYTREVNRCAALSERLADAEMLEPVRGIPRLAYKHSRIAGQGWAMVGDAAAFLDPIYSSGIFLALASAERAADSIHDALVNDDLSPVRLGAFAGPLMAGVHVIHELIHAFYTPGFSFKAFVERFPAQRSALIDCLVGDVFGKDMSEFVSALREIVPPAVPL